MAFEILPDGKKAHIGHQFVQCHMVFEIKMDNFRHKARHVAGGHTTKAPATIIYVSVVSREKSRIAMIIPALNDLEAKSGDISNAYIQAPVTEKMWTPLGPEFGKDARKTAVIVRALYGLKSAGAAFRYHLARCMESMGYMSCKADPDLWLKPKIKPDNGVQYCTYLLCHVDDILCIHQNADALPQ